MDNNIEEVKEDEEISTEEQETVEETPAEETETPDSSSEENKPSEETDAEAGEPDGEAPKEAEEETEEDIETEPEVPEVPKEPDLTAPVEGETPRERALRLEVTRVKGLNRGLRGKKLLGDVQPLAPAGPVELSDEDKKTLEVFNPEEVSNFEKLLPVLAKKLGFVKKDDLSQTNYQTSSQDVLDDWLAKEDHSIYLPENDKGDILFNRLKEEINLYQKPSNPKDWVKILNRAHNEVMGIKTQAPESIAKVHAKQEKIKVASHGPASGGAKKGETIRRSSATPDVAQAIASGALKGFTPEDFS